MTDQSVEGKNVPPDCAGENTADDNITEEKERQQSSPGSVSDANAETAPDARKTELNRQ